VTARTEIGRRELMRNRAVGLVGACVAGLAVWSIGAAFGADYRICVPAGCTFLGPPAMLVTIAAAGLLGWAALAAAERISHRGRRVWTALAVVTTAASIVSHLAVAAVLISAYPGRSS
jgi:Family of unknown function (DUF6069)